MHGVAHLVEQVVRHVRRQEARSSPGRRWQGEHQNYDRILQSFKMRQMLKKHFMSNLPGRFHPEVLYHRPIQEEDVMMYLD